MAERTDDMQMLPVRINVNGENWQGAIPAQETLLEFIRARLRSYRHEALLRISGLRRVHRIGR